jgi:hypothetical protein
MVKKSSGLSHTMWASALQRGNFEGDMRSKNPWLFYGHTPLTQNVKGSGAEATDPQQRPLARWGPCWK